MSLPADADLTERYRPRLVAGAGDLRAASDNTAPARKPVTLDQQSVGRLSRMGAMQHPAMAATQEGHRRARLNAIDAALKRLDEGEFGWCAACGDFIGAKRLNLDPVLTRCVDCAH